MSKDVSILTGRQDKKVWAVLFFITYGVISFAADTIHFIFA